MTDTDNDTSSSSGDEGSRFEIELDSGWPSLTEALKLKASVLKAFLTERFPNTKTVFQQYKDSVGPILVPASTGATDGGTGAVGGAFDHLVRFLIDPAPDVHLPAIGARRYGGRMPTALAELAETMGTRAPSNQELDAPGAVTVFDGPREATVLDQDLLARGCWALSLLTELGRGVPVERSPLAELHPRAASGDELLTLVSPAALEQPAALREQAEAVLVPALTSRVGRWAVGPTFEGSALMNADADLIAAGTLVEVKTVQGAKKKDGTRYAKLDAETLFQLLGYALLDFHDRFGIHELALFSARYGHLATWNLQGLLDILAGHSVDLPALRAEFETFLRDGGPPAVRAQVFPGG